MSELLRASASVRPEPISDVDLAQMRTDLASGQTLSCLADYARIDVDDLLSLLARLDKAEELLGDIRNSACHYRATLSEEDREVLSSSIKRAGDFLSMLADATKSNPHVP